MKRTRKGRLARRALSLLFALTLLWECGALTPKARAADVVAADGTVNFVLWQDVSVSNVQGNLEKYCSGDLRPILMSYRDGGEEYFVCATKDNWRWQSKDYNLVGMPKVSDHRFDEMRDDWRTADGYGETFITIGTFNSLWGRYQKDGGYSGLVLAVSDGNDGPGEFLGPGKHYAGQTLLLKYALRYMLSGYSDDGLKAEIQELSGKYCKNCPLPYGRVSIADGAVYGNTSRFKNYGSFGEAGGMMKVFYHDDTSAYEVLSAPSGTLGYQQSDTSHTVTRREVVYASGQIDTLRTQYEQMQNKKQTLPGKTNKEASLTVDTGLTFEQYIEQYFISQGLDLDEKVTVRDGVITTGDLPALTIPWNQRFSIVRENTKAAEQTPGLSTPNLYFVQRKCPAELGATLPLGG